MTRMPTLNKAKVRSSLLLVVLFHSGWSLPLSAAPASKTVGGSEYATVYFSATNPYKYQLNGRDVVAVDQGEFSVVSLEPGIYYVETLRGFLNMDVDGLAIHKFEKGKTYTVSALYETESGYSLAIVPISPQIVTIGVRPVKYLKTWVYIKEGIASEIEHRHEKIQDRSIIKYSPMKETIGTNDIESVGYEKFLIDDYSGALNHFSVGADRQSPFSLMMLGVLSESGHGAEKDMNKALEYYRRAASMGEINANYMLGTHYYTGSGVVADPIKAAEYFDAAARQGHVNSMINLSAMYISGKQLPQDYLKAYALLKLCDEQKYRECERRLANLVTRYKFSTQMIDDGDRLAREMRSDYSAHGKPNKAGL